MRIGLVKFLNARPLDFGLRQMAKNQSHIEIYEDVPSTLAKMILKKELDIALISSVEYLRHRDLLDCIDSIGVCATNKADSLFYIQPLKPNSDSYRTPVQKIYVDSGSRSTVALMQILYLEDIGPLPEICAVNPDLIPAMLKPNEAGLLIGDTALDFRNSKHSPNYHCMDLISWWNQKFHLPFVTAIWCYSKGYQFDQQIFLDSLATGIRNIPEIANQANRFPDALEYLSRTLHYNIADLETRALQKFEDLLTKHALL